MPRLNRTAAGMAAYRQSGEDMRRLGHKAIREIHDYDNNSTLTFWAGPLGAVIAQTFWDTGDVCLYASINFEALLTQCT